MDKDKLLDRVNRRIEQANTELGSNPNMPIYERYRILGKLEVLVEMKRELLCR